MIIYGKQVFLYYLEHHKEKIEEIYLAKEIDKPLFNKIAKCGVKIQKLDFIKAQAMATGGNHQGFLAKVKDYEFCDFNSLKKSDFLLILYNLNDVGNIGAIIRTAYALGACGIVIIAKDINAANITRTSQGAIVDMKIALSNDALTCINELKQTGFSIIASAKDGKSIVGYKKEGKKALILGNESEGIPNKILSKCDEIVGIKMSNNFDSLNVGAACAILCDRILNG